MRPAKRQTREAVELSNLRIALAATSRCTQAVIRATNESLLTQQVCAIVVDAGYRFCWVGGAEQNNEKTVQPLAWAGYEDGYLSSVKITWSDSEFGQGPTGKAIRTGTVQIIHNMSESRDYGPWSVAAQKRGYVSVCALPLLDRGIAFGSLNIYSADPDAFDAPALGVLTALSETLAYGTNLLRARIEESRVQARLHRAEEMAYLAADAADIGTWDWDLQTNQVTWSDKTKELMGIPHEQEVNYDFFLKTIHPEDREKVERALRRALEEKADYSIVTRSIRSDGEMRWMAVRGRAIFDDSGKPTRMLGVTRDITEQHQAQDDKQKLVAVAQNSPDFIGIASPDARVLFVNEAGQELVGIENDQQATSKMIFDYLPPAEVARFEREILPTVFSGKPWEGEVYLTHFRTGELIPFEMRCFPICDDSQKVIALANVSRDIRKRRSMEEEKQKLVQVVQNSPDFIGIASPDGQGLFINKAGRALVGLDEETSTTSTQIFDYLSPDEMSRAKQEIFPAIFSGKPWSGEVSFRHSQTGEIIPCETRAFPIADDQGTVIAVATVARDIRGRKQLDLVLRQAEEKYRGIFDNAILGIFQSTPDGRYLSVNQAMVHMYGYASPQEMMAAVTDIGHQEYVDPSQRREFIRLLEQHGTVSTFVIEIYRKDQSRGWVSLNARVVRDSQGEVMYYEGTQEDITERKRLEAQYEQAQKMEVVGRLAGGVAHDFNNILGVIIGYCELTMDLAAPTQPVARNISKIKQAAERAADLTGQLLAFSRQQVVRSRVLDLNKIVRNASEMLRRMLGEDITLSFNASTVLGMTKVDPGQIEQILMNLCVNARDAMPGGGKIVIETANVDVDEHYTQSHSGVAPGSYVILAVGDTGSGISKQTLPHIFEPFFTTKGLGKGTGLGLATVHGIVKQSNGYIGVYSEANIGTTFKIYFPRVDAKESASESESDVESRGGTETILLVEDEAPLREVATALLEAAGYKVCKAENGMAALVLAQTAERIDLVVTDVVMPTMSGVELCDRLKQLRPGVKVLYMSGYAGELLNHYAELAPEIMLLAKPFTKQSLLKRVRSVLDS